MLRLIPLIALLLSCESSSDRTDPMLPGEDYTVTQEQVINPVTNHENSILETLTNVQGTAQEPKAKDPGQSEDPHQSEDPSQSEVINGVTIEAIASEGTACSPETVAINIAEDNRSFDLVFSEFIVEKLLDVESSSVACDVNFTLHYPKGWTFSLLSMNYRGALFLDEGVSATVQSDYSFGPELIASETSAIDGFYDDFYQIDLDWKTQTYSSCGGSQDISLSVDAEIVGEGGEGLLTVDSISGLLSSTTYLSWKRCY